MAQPRIASRPPVACACCGGQYPQRAHVDYASSWEGPPVSDRPRAPKIDWVVICENCIRSGARLLPDDPIATARIEERANEIAAARTAALEEQLKAAQAYADKIEDAFQSRPQRPRTTKAGARKSRYAEAEA